MSCSGRWCLRREFWSLGWGWGGGRFVGFWEGKGWDRLDEMEFLGVNEPGVMGERRELLRGGLGGGCRGILVYFWGLVGCGFCGFWLV
jgi:hypothetical protein